MPDVVAAINASGDWGSAQLSGLLHDNRVRTAQGHPPGEPAFDWRANTDSELGWAVLFGTALDVPTTEGSNFTFKAVYADGASHIINAKQETPGGPARRGFSFAPLLPPPRQPARAGVQERQALTFRQFGKMLRRRDDERRARPLHGVAKAC